MSFCLPRTSPNLEDLPCELVAGEDCIHEELLGLKFRISPLSFFQVRKIYSKCREKLLLCVYCLVFYIVFYNTLMCSSSSCGVCLGETTVPVKRACVAWQVNTGAAEVLYSAVGEWAQLDQDSTVLDVCCGTGTIGISLAKVTLLSGK